MPNVSPTVIEFSSTETAFASILLARTEQGVCAILLGDTASELYTDLQTRFPKAHLLENKQALAAWLENVTEFLAAP